MVISCDSYQSCVYSDLLPPGGQRHSKGEVFLCKALIGYLLIAKLQGDFIIFVREKRYFKVYQNEHDSENERVKKSM